MRGGWIMRPKVRVQYNTYIERGGGVEQRGMRGLGTVSWGKRVESDFKIKSFYNLVDLCNPQLHAGFMRLANDV